MGGWGWGEGESWRRSAARPWPVTAARHAAPHCLGHRSHRDHHPSQVQNGVAQYSFDDLRRDWKMACMHFPLYVALWFGHHAESAVLVAPQLATLAC